MNTLSRWATAAWCGYLKWSGLGYDAWRARHPRSSLPTLAADRSTPCPSCTCA